MAVMDVAISAIIDRAGRVPARKTTLRPAKRPTRRVFTVASMAMAVPAAAYRAGCATTGQTNQLSSARNRLVHRISPAEPHKYAAGDASAGPTAARQAALRPMDRSAGSLVTVACLVLAIPAAPDRAGCFPTR